MKIEQELAEFLKTDNWTSSISSNHPRKQPFLELQIGNNNSCKLNMLINYVR